MSVDVFSTKVLIRDTIFLLLQLDTGSPFYVVIRATRRSIYPFAGQRKYLHFLVILRPRVFVRPRI